MIPLGPHCPTTILHFSGIMFQHGCHMQLSSGQFTLPSRSALGNPVHSSSTPYLSSSPSSCEISDVNPIRSAHSVPFHHVPHTHLSGTSDMLHILAIRQRHSLLRMETLVHWEGTTCRLCDKAFDFLSTFWEHDTELPIAVEQNSAFHSHTDLSGFEPLNVNDQRHFSFRFKLSFSIRLSSGLNSVQFSLAIAFILCGYLC